MPSVGEGVVVGSMMKMSSWGERTGLISRDEEVAITIAVASASDSPTLIPDMQSP